MRERNRIENEKYEKQIMVLFPADMDGLTPASDIG